MTELQTTWETYTSALNAATLEEKLAKLAECAREDLVYDDPVVSKKGTAALAEYMVSLAEVNPGGRFETTELTIHHGQSLARWNVVSASGIKVGEGTSYAAYDAEAKVVKVAVFFRT